MSNLCIIPARLRSKTLKKKNIKLFNKKPLIYWTIKAALNSRCFDIVHVSTDSIIIKNLAVKYGAQVPFLRPKILSSDKTTMFEVVKYVVKYYKKYFSYNPTTVTILQPTSPLRDQKDILTAFQIFKKKKADSLVSIVKLNHYQTPNHLYKLKKNILTTFSNNRKVQLVNRQEIKNNIYSRNGAAIYITKAKKIFNYIIGGKLAAYVMPLSKSIDINTREDFLLAEAAQKKFNYNIKQIKVS
jgi:CMP-N,N'-diacetyllegionaminic acid synthase